MNTMQSFYASLSSTAGHQGIYMKALAILTRINRKQMDALVSGLGWQNWGEQIQKTAVS